MHDLGKLPISKIALWMAWIFFLFFPGLFLLGAGFNNVDGEWLLSLGFFSALGLAIAAHVFAARIEISKTELIYRSLYGGKLRKGTIARADIKNFNFDDEAPFFNIQIYSDAKTHQVHFGYHSREHIATLEKWLSAS